MQAPKIGPKPEILNLKHLTQFVSSVSLAKPYYTLNPKAVNPNPLTQFDSAVSIIRPKARNPKP